MGKAFIAVLIIATPLELFERSGNRIGWDLTEGDSCLPFTFYLYKPGDMDISKGDYLAFRARRMQPYYDDGRIIIKELVGIAGDRVQVGDKVYVDDQYWGNLPHLRKLKKVVADFARDEIVPEGKYWVMGTHPRSYDSRYWGYVEREQIIGKASALW